MMWGHQTWSSAWMWVFIGLCLGLIGALVVSLVGISSRQPEELPEEDGRRQRGWSQGSIIVATVLAVLTLAAGVAATLSSTGGARSQPSCSASGLPGQLVDVTVADMGGMMGTRMPTWQGGQLTPGAGSGMMGGGGMMGGAEAYGYMMSVMVSPTSAASGEVSFRVWNAGTLVHELVIMPMPAGGLGSRSVGTDGKVSEDGSLGEASNSCGEGAGEGIRPGAESWVTLNLDSGRYELMCNIAGHYSMGMYSALTIS
jgi:uncharacterized cupredoxin-like copper-binding protein